jgi:3-deoxy-7-phosphoheptulonate synthase
MVVVVKSGTSQQDIEKLAELIRQEGVEVKITFGKDTSILGLVGDTSSVNREKIEMHQHVEKVMRVQEPFKKANRKFKPDDTIVNVNGRKIGGGNIGIIAGPCSVESEEQVVEIARRVKAAGASFLRGGAYKPRSSPYSFQGLEIQGLRMLKTASEETGLPIVTEILSTRVLDIFLEMVDVIQVGARNMQNFDLLKELGKIRKPILLKRGLSSTLEELLMSAEYIMAGGNDEIILCERGIRTFEPYTRNTLDISAIPVLKKYTHLPVVVDPSHACGHAAYVESLSKASLACGADGLEIEVHNNPAQALSDGMQSLTPDAFDALMIKLRQISELDGKILS